MTQILNILIIAFGSCVNWTNQLFTATDGLGVVVAAFIIVLCVSLFLMPLRGLGSANGSTALGDLVKQATYKGKHANGNKVLFRRGKGKFEKRSYGKGGNGVHAK